MPQTPESQLAYLGFQLVAPSQILRPYVREYWYLECEARLSAYHEEYMHPRGGFGIVFNLGDKVRLDAELIAKPIFLDGVNTVSRKVGFPGHVELIGISFYEGGAYPFLGIPLVELLNDTTFLDALDRPDLLRLHARLYEASSLLARIQLIEEWLISRLSLGKAQDPLIPASLTRLREREGQLPIPELARELAVSQRHLERLYQSQVGMSPKQYARLLRVETARLALKQMNGQSTAGLAAELGFFDQSHFIREFNAVIGMTPYAYVKRSHKRTASG